MPSHGIAAAPEADEDGAASTSGASSEERGHPRPKSWWPRPFPPVVFAEPAGLDPEELLFRRW